ERSWAAKPTVVKEHLGPRSGVSPTARRRSTWVFSLAETTVPQMLLMTLEKSPAYQILDRRLFLSYGVTKMVCNVCRCSEVTTAGKPWPSTNTATLRAFLRG